MHCRRSLLRCGLQLLRREENRRLLSLSPAVTQIVKSAYPDVTVPTVSLPEYVWSRIDEWPDKVALECSITGRNYTYAEARELSRRFAASLYRIGLQPGDTIAIIMPNFPEWPIIFLGALEAGIVVTTLNPTSTADEISRQLRDSEVKAIVTISLSHSTIMKVIRMVGGKWNPLIIIAPGIEQSSQIPAGVIDLMELLQDGIDTSNVRFSENIDDMAILPYSSGTTGLPKGVMLSQKHLATACEQLNSREEVCLSQPTTECHQDICPAILPFYHLFGMCIVMLPKMCHGVKLVTIPKFEPKSFVKLLEQYDVNLMYTIPPLFLFMASNPALKPVHFRSLMYTVCGAAPLGKLDIERFLEKVPKSANILQGYALTETTAIATLMEKDEINYESVGGPLPNTQMKILHLETGVDLGHREVGEICIRGPQIMKGYFNRPDATAATIDADGWLHSGDVGYYDEQGKFYIVDRAKELIKVKGFQVAPAELEEILRSHPHIEDAAVIGIPDERAGEIPKAFVVPKRKISEEDVKKYVAEKWQKMHCRRSLLRCGLQFFRRHEGRRLLSLSPAVTQIVKSAFPDVTVPTVSLPEYVWSRIDEWPDKVAVECGITGRHYRYAEARELSRRFAASLHRIGLQPGDTIAIIMPNSPEWPIVFLGALEAGVKVTTINPIYTADEISHQLRDSEVKAIVTISLSHLTVMKAIKMVASKTNPIIIIAPGFEQGSHLPAGTIDLMELLQDGIDTSSVRFPGDVNDIAVLPYSSGTTGLPKGVMLSQRNVVAGCAEVNSRTEICFSEPAIGSHQDVTLVLLPFYHIYGMCIIMLGRMFHGVKIVTLPKFEPISFVKQLEQHDVNFLYVAPPLLLFMASHPALKPEHLRSLRYALCGAAPLGKLDIERFLKKAPKSTNVIQGYGLTETAGVTSVMEKNSTNYESVGGPTPNTQMKISHLETGAALGHREVGEICIRGPQVMKGYYNRPDATAETIDGEGWLHTGDTGYYDEQGKFYIIDRAKELIKVKGFQVAPAELEEILRSHPHIEDAAVVGIPDERAGEIPKAFVVPKEKKISEEEVKKYVAEKVSDYKHLKGGVEFISSIPKSPSGKILRRMLKEQR